MGENHKEEERDLDIIRGSLIGGAVGDALGYPVEFLYDSEIAEKYGSQGISAYKLGQGGMAEISDDTQMTLFTASGILAWLADRQRRETEAGRPVEDFIWDAYLDWYGMQRGRRPEAKKKASGPADGRKAGKKRPGPTDVPEGGKKPSGSADAPEPEKKYSWLADVPEMGAFRAPGNTCMDALRNGRQGSMDSPLNHSKGCGGIMRIAPAALAFNRNPQEPDQIEVVDEIAARAAALTHGHPLGWLSAAAAAHIINRIAYLRLGMEEAVRDAMAYLKDKYKEIAYMDKLLKIMEKAMVLSQNEKPDGENIRALGEGWIAEETLAIAIYCCVRHENDFSGAVRAAVNHSGDSDSTGAVTGNILGAAWGYNRIPDQWKEKLECRDVILKIADEICV